MLYSNWAFKKLKLDKSQFLKEHIAFGINRKLPKIYESTIPDNPNIKVHSITLLDCIENEDSKILKNRLIKVVSRYKGGFLSQDPSEKLEKAFENFETSYKTTTWGKIFYNDTKENDELDLIDGISFSYVKGAQSHFIINYTIFPSEKFNLLFKESLKSEITEETEIIFKSLTQILRNKGLFSSIRYNVKQPGFWTQKLFNEVNFQVKSMVSKDLKLGFFNKDKLFLFPRIISFEYNPSDLTLYKDELFQLLNINDHECYNSSETIFTLNNADYSKPFANSLELFFPYKTDEEKRKDQFSGISYLSDNYISVIAPHWLLINISAINKREIIELRKKTFLYIRKNKVTVFLKRAINLKNRLSLCWISFERIRKDFSTRIFKTQLDFQGLPDAMNTPWGQGIQPQEFKKNLVDYAYHTSKDVKESYEEILELFKYISDDNAARANMRLQRLLFIIAIVGILLGVYGANSDWVNSWIEYYFSNWGFEIPKPPRN
jgi:hypothetical protein